MLTKYEVLDRFRLRSRTSPRRCSRSAFGPTKADGKIRQRSLLQSTDSRTDPMKRDKAKARGAYQDFLGLWKDTDPDIPILLP